MRSVALEQAANRLAEVARLRSAAWTALADDLDGSGSECGPAVVAAAAWRPGGAHAVGPALDALAGTAPGAPPDGLPALLRRVAHKAAEEADIWTVDADKARKARLEQHRLMQDEVGPVLEAIAATVDGGSRPAALVEVAIQLARLETGSWGHPQTK